MIPWTVHWTIDIEADTPEEAARLAKEIQLRPDSIANVFVVEHHESRVSYEIDLDELN